MLAGLDLGLALFLSGLDPNLMALGPSDWACRVIELAQIGWLGHSSLSVQAFLGLLPVLAIC